MTTTTTTALTITTIENEPRVLDTDLGIELGMADPRKIRQHIILAHQVELEDFGTLLTRRVTSGGRPAQTFYLNEEQALLACMLSMTPTAKKVRAEVIRVFTAYRRGTLVPAAAPAIQAPTSLKEALLLAVRQCEQIEMLTTIRRVALAKREPGSRVKCTDKLVLLCGALEADPSGLLTDAGPSVETTMLAFGACSIYSCLTRCPSVFHLCG